MPLSVTRTYVKHVDVGVFPQARRAHQVTRCNQCAHAPCVTACPTTAMFKRADGIVDFDKSICIGCKACMAACPYDAIFINPEDHSAEKCNFCAHRIDIGLEPACVVVCPTQAILVGDMNDSDSYVAQIVNREAVAVRRRKKRRCRSCFIKARTRRRSIRWRRAVLKAGSSCGASNSRHGPRRFQQSALQPTHPPRHSCRTTSRIRSRGTGASVFIHGPRESRPEFYLVASLLVLLGVLGANSFAWAWATPIVSGAFLAFTGGLLLWDLEHPGRFYLIFTRPQWRSWLVKGAFIIAGYTLVLVAHFLATLGRIGVGSEVVADDSGDSVVGGSRRFTRLISSRRLRRATYGRTRCCRRTCSFKRCCWVRRCCCWWLRCSVVARGLSERG